MDTKNGIDPNSCVHEEMEEEEKFRRFCDLEDIVYEGFKNRTIDDNLDEYYDYDCVTHLNNMHNLVYGKLDSKCNFKIILWHYPSENRKAYFLF